MTGQYRVILADPPWPGYGAAHFRLKARMPELPRNHYATMTARQLSMLPVAGLAGDDSALFMWATMPLLPEALQVMSAWGFEYVTTAFVWVKICKEDGRPRKGLGQYTRQNAELCLLGIRGRIQRTRKARDVHQIIATVRREHSRKPDEQYGRIMRLFDGPYLELFARQQWPGWDVWGNETGRFPAQPFLIGEDAV